MTITSIVSRLTNNFFSRLMLLFSKTIRLPFWSKLLTKENVTQDTSYNLAPLVGVIMGFIIALVVILGRLIFSYRVTATVVAFICYLFFGFANSLYGLALAVGANKNNDTTSVTLNKYGIITIILAVIVWCICITCTRPARLFLSLMSAFCISRFASCIVVYIENCHANFQIKKTSMNTFDKVDLIVAILCTAPWLILNFKRCFPTILFATAFAIITTKFIKCNSHATTSKISSAAIILTEIFSLLIWLI